MVQEQITHFTPTSFHQLDLDLQPVTFANGHFTAPTNSDDYTFNTFYFEYTKNEGEEYNIHWEVTGPSSATVDFQLPDLSVFGLLDPDFSLGQLQPYAAKFEKHDQLSYPLYIEGQRGDQINTQIYYSKYFN